MIENKKLILVKMASDDDFNYQDIVEAIQNININLKSRYHSSICLKNFKKKEILLELTGNLKGNIGNHLRGISSYLLNKNYDFYESKKVGKRLLTFKEIPKEFIDEQKHDLDQMDKFELIEDFIKLLKDSNNVQNLEKISKIIDIINE